MVQWFTGQEEFGEKTPNDGRGVLAGGGPQGPPGREVRAAEAPAGDPLGADRAAVLDRVAQGPPPEAQLQRQPRHRQADAARQQAEGVRLCVAAEAGLHGPTVPTTLFLGERPVSPRKESSSSSAVEPRHEKKSRSIFLIILWQEIGFFLPVGCDFEQRWV